ncbi:MAG: exopolyphosphatase/guanosine-5'-triphosphate,3'-diphosphate pyrophosphatase [Saprospiraceae bacterium]|jgi:exopolyphosphatase/guanosine-5'-triphosphate,3'-diphosphate pyrophosphatase
MIKSVIDIGTNTAHLLIGEVRQKNLIRTILKHREYTYLGEHGLDKIHKKPLKRLFEALVVFRKLTQEHGSQSLLIIGTEALRAASNGPEIQSKIEEISGSKPFIISGETEANLIRRGAELSLELIPHNYLIMDIGGGSVEFIHVVNGKQVLLRSLPLGISRLYERCNGSEKLNKEIVMGIKDHIKNIAYQILSSCKKHDTELTLIGSAGTFEIFLPEGHLEDPTIKQSTIPISKIKERYEEVLYLDSNDRSEISWLPAVRSKYIIVALILMQTIIEETNPERLIVSKYALKEGAIITNSSSLRSNF